MATVDRGVRLGGDTRDYNHATDGEYKRLRSEADRLFKKRQELSNKSQQAYKSGDKGRAHELSEEAKKVEHDADECNKRAAEYVFKENNSDSAPDEIDLHGLYVKEAEWILQRRIRAAIERRELHLRVIVGKGIHSQGGVAKIKPAVDNLCDELNLKHYIDKKNTGVLVIELNGQPQQSYQGHQQGYQQPYQGQGQPQYYPQQQQQQQNNYSGLAGLLLKLVCQCINK